jgi:adenine-specific DNA-methyltransferase
MAKKKVESLRHKDKRKNIPTEELRDFVADDEHAPKTMLYPRDPSLDPQLVWKGKDEQDRADLAVPVVPIYIQEKMHQEQRTTEVPHAVYGKDNRDGNRRTVQLASPQGRRASANDSRRKSQSVIDPSRRSGVPLG